MYGPGLLGIAYEVISESQKVMGQEKYWLLFYCRFGKG